MFIGITSHHTTKRVASYADAQMALERASRTPTGRARTVKPQGFPMGGHSKSVTWVRHDESDGAIAFTLYATDVVTWMPDNSVLIDNYGTTTTSGFASRFLPGGISLRHPVERRGESGGDKAIRYQPPHDASWHGARLCAGGIVRFTEQDGGWVPDETTLDDLRYPVLDQRKARAATKGMPFKDFDNWLAMAPMHLNLEHQQWDLTTCMDALIDRNFRRAAEHLPLIEPGSGFGTAERIKPLPITTPWGKHVTMGSIAKLKLAIWEAEGAFEDIRVKTIRCHDHDRLMARVREMSRLGIYGGDYGPGA